MPQVELMPVPTDPRNYKAYLTNNFRRVADVITRLADKVGHEDITITDFDHGIVLTSPDGTRFRVTVEDDGSLSTNVV